MRFSKTIREFMNKPCPWCLRVMDGKIASRHNPCFPTRDHLTPRCRVPKDHPKRNQMVIVVVCARCNESKKDMTIDEWLDRLRKGNDPRAIYVAQWMMLNRDLVTRARDFLIPVKVAA